jgi:hypothetical protein
VAAGRYDHGCGPIEFSGEREREASFPDILRVFRRIEVDLHYLIVYTNKRTINPNRQGFRSRLSTARSRDRRRPRSPKNRELSPYFCIWLMCAQMTAMLDLDSTFTRAWLPSMRPLFVGIGLERNRVPSPRFVHPGCTATTSRIQVGEMLLHDGAEAYKQEGRAQVHAAPGCQAEGQG